MQNALAAVPVHIGRDRGHVLGGDAVEVRVSHSAASVTVSDRDCPARTRAEPPLWWAVLVTAVVAVPFANGCSVRRSPRSWVVSVEQVDGFKRLGLSLAEVRRGYRGSRVCGTTSPDS